MATRPVFITWEKPPYVRMFSPEFVWNAGFAVSQKQKNIVALHQAFTATHPQHRILEISSKSLQDTGIKLSAFNLKKYVPSLGTSVPVECVYQGGKRFTEAGPFTDLYTVTAKEAKKDSRLRENGRICGFYFEGENIPPNPPSAFYTWLYINALLENPDLADAVTEYDAFTDIEFNPQESLNCQAEAAAVYVSLFRQRLLEECRNFTDFVNLISARKV